jgi:DNA-binding transcriptional ArsR family regulator
MAFQSENNSKLHEEVIDHFSSTVVEGISFLARLVKNRQPDIAPLLMAELSEDSKQFLIKWEKSSFDFTMLLNLLLPFPYFHEMKLFLERVSQINNLEFLYHFFAEDIPMSQLEQLLEDPSAIYSFEKSHWWRTEKKLKKFIELASTIDVFRESLNTVLLEITNSSEFRRELESKEPLLNQQMDQLKTYDMVGLAMAQYVMGKPFKRTSLYEAFYFVPSYFLTHEKIRIFDSKTCLIIYNVTTTLIDVKETSQDYERRLKALSDRNRLLILRLLSNRQEYGAKIAEYLGITTATVSHHLELLKKAGFITEEKIGTIKYFTYNKEYGENFFSEIENFINHKK